MRAKIFPILVSCLLIVSAAPSASQVTARQGEAPPPEITHFASPMILDLPLPNVAPLKPGAQLKLAEVRKYVCDNHVSLLSLTVERQYKGSRRSRSLELVVSGLVLVLDSYDRRVDVGLRLRSGDEVVVSRAQRNLKAEEERSTPFQVVVPIDEAKLLAMLSKELAPTLEITLTVRDDS